LGRLTDHIQILHTRLQRRRWLRKSKSGGDGGSGGGLEGGPTKQNPKAGRSKDGEWVFWEEQKKRELVK